MTAVKVYGDSGKLTLQTEIESTGWTRRPKDRSADGLPSAPRYIDSREGGHAFRSNHSPMISASLSVWAVAHATSKATVFFVAVRIFMSASSVQVMRIA